VVTAKYANLINYAKMSKSGDDSIFSNRTLFKAELAKIFEVEYE